MASRVTLKGSLTKRMVRGERRTAKVVEKTAKNIAAGSARRSRVDKGEMRDGWVAVEVQTSGDEVKWQAGNPVEHAIYNEFGTRRMSAQPMLTPAVEAAREPFARDIRKAYDR